MTKVATSRLSVQKIHGSLIIRELSIWYLVDFST